MEDEKKQAVNGHGPFPETDGQSFGYHTAQATLGGLGDATFPGLGYILQTLVGRFIGDPLQRRREDWFRTVGLGLADLQQRLDGFDPASLADNEDFVSAVYEATHLAMKTHKAEKLEALSNTVLNTAAGLSLSETVRGRFLQLVDAYSPMHVAVLRVMSQPMANAKFAAASQNTTMGSPIHPLRAALDQPPQAVLDEVLADLESARLLGSGWNVTMSGQGIREPRTTSLGTTFLRFISRPP